MGVVRSRGWLGRNWGRFAILRPIAGGVVIGLILFVALVSLAPDAVAFSPNNYGWNGIHDVSSKYSIQPIGSISEIKLGQDKNVLLVMQPVTQFSTEYADSAAAFVKKGGTLVIADSEGTSNSLLAAMNVSIRVETQYALYDPIYNWKAQSLPTALVLDSAQAFGTLFSGVKGIALNSPSPLLVSGASKIAITSASSFEVSRSSSNLLGGNPAPIAKGPFVVAAAEKIGRGTVLVIGSSAFFTNPVAGIADNGALVSDLLSNASVYVDVSHWPVNTAGSLKALIASVYSRLSQYPLNYLLTLLFVGVSLVLLPAFSDMGAFKERNYEKADTAYDERIVSRVRKDRERYGVDPGKE